jgi:DNA ligase 1
LREIEIVLGPLTEWIVEWKFDGIRAQFANGANAWSIWSRGEELITAGYPELQLLANALPRALRLDGELVVMGEADAPDDISGLRPFSALQQRLGRKLVTLKTRAELPVVFIAYDLLESDGRDLRGLPQQERRAALESVVASAFRSAQAHGEPIPLRLSPIVIAGDWADLAVRREEARARGVEGLMLKARRGEYGVGRRKGDDRTNVVEMEARSAER